MPTTLDGTSLAVVAGAVVAAAGIAEIGNSKYVGASSDLMVLRQVYFGIAVVVAGVVARNML